MKRDVTGYAIKMLFAGFAGLLLGIVLCLVYMEQRLSELQTGQQAIMLRMEQELRMQRYELMVLGEDVSASALK